jgi:hypothetical protein
MSLDTLIADTRKAISDDAASAQAVFTVHGRWSGLPKWTSGRGRTPSRSTSRLSWAAQLGVELDTLSVRVEGDLDLRGFFGVDDQVRAGFTAVRVEVTLAGPESEQRYAELAAAVDEHCPVLDLFKNPVPVSRALVTSG